MTPDELHDAGFVIVPAHARRIGTGMNDLAPIKARLEAATTIDWDQSWRWVDKFLVGWADSYILETVNRVSPGDAALIAHAPTDIAALVAEVERLRALQRAVNTVLDLVEDEESVNMFAQVFEAQEALLAVARKIR